MTWYFRYPSTDCPRSFAIRRLVCVLGLLALGTTLRADTVVFRDGKALLPVYVSAGATEDEKAAATELARVLGVMAGTEWPVLTESARGGAGLYVGHTRAAARTLPELKPAKDLLAPKADEVGPDGFRIRSVGGRVFIEGATPEATPFAVSWLLQRYAGVRWYAPGPLGEVIPRRNAWTLPDLQIVREPAYVSREISGLHGPDGRDWARRNGLRGRLEYSHNLVNLFTPEVFDAHPEWFGIVRGERRRPLGGGDYHWQPDLSRTDVAEFAAAKATEAFAREPGRASFSLGMNDTVRFDQGEGTRAVVEPLRYFRGMPDYSSLIMTFMNRAAESLGSKLPDRSEKYLGCLAYFWCENPPTFPVNPGVVPYVTTDRTQFYDPAYRAADYALMSRWGRSGVRAFGLWEYAEGNAFLVPRVPHAMLADAVREGWWRGARGYMGECGPHAGFDAFKVWMLAQLLWEPDRPLAELEADFFNGWYGPAAPAMRRFFARCEAAWMAQQGPPWWIKFYQQQDQVLLFPPEVCRELRGDLEEAATRVAGGELQVTGDRRTEDESLLSQAAPQRAAVECSGVRENADGRTEGETRTRFALSGNPGLLTPNPEPEASAIAARIALTSRAFSVTEAAVEFDALRRELAAPGAENLSPAELGGRLVAMQRARARLEQALATAVESGAMASVKIGYLLRNDPVPRLLAALGRRDREAPMAALAELALAGEPVPAHWTALAAALAKGRLAQAVDLASNGSFVVLAPGGQQPRFLYPRSGEVPSGWDVRATPTEAGLVALGPAAAGEQQSLASTDVELAAFRQVRGCYGEAGRVPAGTRPGRTLRIEGAWDTQVNQMLPAQAGRLYVAEVRMRGRSSPGNDAALALAFVDAGGKLVGEYRSVMLPKGENSWRTLTLADTAPADAKYVVVGLAVMRQFGGDWAEATGVTLRGVEP